MDRFASRVLSLAMFLIAGACAEPADEPCVQEDGNCLDDEESVAGLELALLPPPPPFYANVNVVSAYTADGTVSASSSSSGARCSAEGCTVRIGSRVTVVATPAVGRSFARWSGCSTSTSPILTVSAWRNTTCTANFTTTRLVVRADSSPLQGGSVHVSSPSSGASCSGNQCRVSAGASVSLSASAANGYRFDGWAGCSSATSSTLTLSNVQTSLSCTARFSPLVF